MDELVSLFDNINVNKDWEEFCRLHNGLVNNNNFQSLYYYLHEIKKYYTFLLSKFEYDLSIYPEEDRDGWNNIFSGMQTFVELYDKKDYSGDDIERSKELTNIGGFVYRNLSNIID